MKFGVNLLLFGDSVTPAIRKRFRQVKDMGFDGVEVPIFNPGAVDAEGIRASAEACGLAITTSGALPPGTRFYGKAAAPRKAAERYTRDSIRVVAELGASVICGPLYKAVGDADLSLPLDRQRRETAKAMRPLAAEAEAAGVVFAFEALNRFETNFLNTVEQGIAFCRALKSPAAGLLLDTFHMHIEEKDTAAAIRAAARAGVLAHFHASENDRGIAGSGQVRWPEVAGALRAARYNEWVVLESFNQANEAIKTAVSCWRPFYPSEKEFLRKGLGFVKKTLARR
jgi:D-psicose/D-tagatose/L-ribulose 3-epimerase